MSDSPADSPEARRHLIANNARATRIALLVAGFAGQFALLPLLPVVVIATGAVGLLAVGISSLHLPLVGDTARGRVWWNWQWRQVIALVLILSAGVLAMTQLRAGDSASEARTLAVMLVFVQVAHALALGTRREAGLGCAVAVAMFAVAAVFAGDVTVLLPLCIGFGAIAVVGTLLHRAALLDSADAFAPVTTSTVVRACLGPIVVAIGVGAVVFLAVPNSNNLHGRQHFGGSAAASGSHDSERARAGLSSSTVDLLARGPLSDAPVLSTPVDAPQYWQGAIYDSFDGTRWTAAPVVSSGFWQLSSAVSSNGQRVQVAPNSPAGSPTGNGATRTDDVTVLSSTPLDAVFAPGVATAYAGPGRVMSDTDSTPRLAGFSANPPQYQVTSVSPAASDAELRAASGPDPTDPKWTVVPAAIAPRVADLAKQLTATASNRLDAVNAVENYLRSNEKYDLNSPEPAPGEDAVDDFVFISHRGFCEQFATAAVVMLRSVGIPARLVTGYAVGETTTDPGQRIFRGTDAHAWVQVYYPGVGWVGSDPTASQAVATSADTPIRQRIVGALTDAWHRMPGGRGGALLLLCVLLAGGFATAVLVGRRRADGRLHRLVAARDRDGPILAAYVRLEAELVRADRARQPDETFGEFAGRLGGLAATPREVVTAIRLLERECYGRESRRPTAAEAASATEVFDRLRAGSVGATDSGCRVGGR